MQYFTYKNPIWPESVPDPSVIRAQDGRVYCYGTPDIREDGSVSQIPILSSPDMVEWAYEGSVFSTCPSWEGGEVLWACEVAKIKENYVLYYTLMDGEGKPRIGCAFAKSPKGPFTDAGCMIRPEDALGIWAIDPFPVEDEAGKWHLICGNYEQGTCIFPLSDDGLSLSGPAVFLTPGYEGMCVIPRNGYYYMLGSLGTCTDEEHTSYHMVCARSKNLYGPYTDRNGLPVTEETKDGEELLVVGGSKEGEGRFIGPGNASFLTDDAGEIWLVLHAVDRQHMFLKDGGTKRVLCMEKLYWDEAGWPYTEEKQVLEKERPAPYFKKR